MLFYERAPYHMIIHFLLGFIANWIPAIGIVAVLYQILQFVANIRTFPMEFRIESGNSIPHTGLKLLEIALGYSIGYLTKNYLL